MAPNLPAVSWVKYMIFQSPNYNLAYVDEVESWDRYHKTLAESDSAWQHGSSRSSQLWYQDVNLP